MNERELLLACLEEADDVQLALETFEYFLSNPGALVAALALPSKSEPTDGWIMLPDDFLDDLFPRRAPAPALAVKDERPIVVNVSVPKQEPPSVKVDVAAPSVTVTNQVPPAPPSPIEVKNDILVNPTPVEVNNSIDVNPTPVEVNNAIDVKPTPVEITNEVTVQTPSTKTVKYLRDGADRVIGAEVKES